MLYEPTIGLEIHVELKTKTKMFCNSLNDPDEKHPNVNVCEVCLAHPGSLPVINQEAINKLLQVGLALNCQVAEVSKFDRKNYFYPDLPKGYQISQYDMPLCKDGWLEIGEKKVNIERIHIEEDTGRLLHPVADPSAPVGAGYSLVDFNRAGVPLMELVTRPDFTNGREVEKFAKELQLIMRYLNASSADMEKGQLRIEVNISVKRKTPSEKDNGKLGTKVEIKNINSINAAGRAVDYEIKRQTELLEKGEKIAQETRGWDEIKQKTISQRSKESAHDYRYFPEPDLPPMRFIKDQTEEIRLGLPELPAARRARFAQEYALNASQVEIFTIAKHLGDYYEKVASELGTADKKLYTLAANYIITEFPPLLNMQGMEIDDLAGLQITPEAFAQLINLLAERKLSSTAAKAVLKEMAAAGLHPEAIVKEKNLGQVSDIGELQKVIDGVIANHPKAVADYRKGKIEVIKFLVGQVMAATHGQANPSVVSELLEKHLR
ncbi:MAG: Asp-tRNA(Asn)/Glu-tRNA(Gln) amidotransferase subunit GatB [Patescibacteria group bacterium]